MRKKQKDGFIVVSAFSKNPPQCRISSLVITYFVAMSFGAFLLLKSNGFKRIVVFVLLLLFLEEITRWFSKLRGEFSRSPFNKLQRYIFDNHLYEDELRTVGYDRNGNAKQKRVIVNSAFFSYEKTSDDLIIRAWKNADRFCDRANKQDTMLSALFGKEVYKKFDNLQYCGYVFELVADKRLEMRKDKHAEGVYIEITGKVK